MKPKPKKLTQEELNIIINSWDVNGPMPKKDEMYHTVIMDFKRIFGHISALNAIVEKIHSRFEILDL